MRIVAFLSVLSCIFFLTACSQFDPFVDSRREAGQVAYVGSSTKNNPVVCYGFVGEQSDFDALAEDECAKTNRHAVFDRTETFSCKLFTPKKAIYRCEKTKK